MSDTAPKCLSDLARKAKTEVETVRYYIRVGLLKDPRQPGSLTCMASALQTLRFIRRSRELGFSIREIRQLLDLRSSPEARRGDVRQFVALKINELGTQISRLTEIRAELQSLVQRCRAESATAQCPILSGLQPETDSN